MSARRITASRLYLAEVCPGSHALPWTDSRSKAAETGTIGHAFLERCGNGDLDGALELLPDEIRARCEAINLRKIFALFGTELRTEITFAFDTETGRARELGQGLGRDYSKAAATEIVGTADAISRTKVGDFKFGQSFVNRPKENWQFRFGAVCNAQVTGVDEQEGALIKIDEAGDEMIVRDTFNVFALDGHAAELVQIGRKVRGAQMAVEDGRRPDLVVGDHCGYCPARWNCPAQVSASQALVETSGRSDVLTPETAGIAWMQVRAIEKVVEQMKAVLADFAKDTPIPLPNGKVVRPVESRIDVIDLLVTLTYAKEIGLDTKKFIAEASITKPDLERVLGGKKELKDFLAELGRKGGVGTAMRTSMREVNP